MQSRAPKNSLGNFGWKLLNLLADLDIEIRGRGRFSKNSLLISLLWAAAL
jgi:hypothetical protein